MTAPAQRLGVQYADAAIERVLDLSDDYPYFLQAFGQAAWNQAGESPISRADVDAGLEFAREELDGGFFGPRLQRATPRQQNYLKAMARLGDGPIDAASVASVLGAPTTTLSPVRDALIKKGLVYSPERGALAFTVPHFAAYLRAQ